jgi:hypothetical protein
MNPWRFFRISLRTFLLAFTAIAVGIPIWYRWPYTEEVSHYPTIRQPDGTHIPDTSRPPWQRVVTTWRRVWGQGRVRWGPETTYDSTGRVTRVISCFEDHPLSQESSSRRMVPCSFDPVVPAPASFAASSKRASDKQPEIVGQLKNGIAEGIWLYNHPSGCQIASSWHSELLDGPFEVRWPGAEPFRMAFSAGHLTQVEGRSVPSALFHDLAQERVAPPMAKKLSEPVRMQFIQTPFEDAMQILQDRYSVQIIIDPRSCDVELPVTQSLGGLNFASALFLLLHPHRLDCDYRHECLWITSEAKATIPPSFQLLDQRQGESAVPEPIRATLARTERTEFSDTPLTFAAEILSDRSGIPVLVDARAVDPELPVTLNVHDVSLQSVICALCDLHDLDCHYRYGALWFTARDEGGSRPDPTGITALTPIDGSPLQAAWNHDVYSKHTREESLTSFVTRLSSEKGLTVDIYRIGGVERLQVRTGWKDFPLRHVLGIFLFENGLCCRLEGDKLVLLPVAD